MKKRFLTLIFTIAAMLTCIFGLSACGKVDFKVNFVVDGEVYATLNTNGEEVIKMPENPTKDDYVFDGWYWDKDTWKTPFTANSLLDAPLSFDMNVYCKWKPKQEESGEETKGEEPNAGLSFKTLNVDGTNVYGKVSNATETFSFLEEVTAFGLSKFTVALDIYGAQQVATKTIALSVGDNTAYILETIDGETVKVYTVMVRRRPMYTVSFETNGGTAVQSQQVEEDSFATAPETTPERLGYTFEKWDYDFAEAITEDTIIGARWELVTYKVFYELNGGDNAESNPTTYTIEDNITLSVPLKTGYTGCWDNGGKIETGSTGNKIFAAIWSADVTLSADGKTVTGLKNNVNNLVILNEYNGIKVTSIGSSAFSGCNSLMSVTIPNSVTSIGASAFDNCSSLTGVYISDIAAWCNISFGSYNANPLSYAHNLYLNNELVIELTIPDGVTSIGDSAFRGCSSITSVTNLNSVTSIGDFAFSNCSSLTSVNIPDSVTSIGASVFSYCSSLTSITIPNSVTSIGDGAFGGCSSLQYNVNEKIKYIGNANNPYLVVMGVTDTTLKSCSIDNNAKIIYDDAFRSCSSLTSVIIPDSVTSIGSDAFSSCSRLTSVTIPDSVTSIGSDAFSSCSRLTSVTIPDSVTSIGYGTFRYCSSLASVTIGSSVTRIGYDAFYNCSSLTSVYITDIAAWCNISFGTYANPLYYAHNLYLNNELVTELTIPDSVTNIGDSAFYGCSSLTSVTIPNSVTSIGSDAFRSCHSLTSVTIGNSVTCIGSSAFCGCPKLIEVKNLSTLNITAGSSDYGDIGYCAKRVYSEGESYLSTDENGYIIYDDGMDKILVGYSGTETDLTLPSGIPQIYKYAFYNCSSLTSITIPDGVTSIGYYAFYDCSSLTSVTIGNNVTSIGSSAFRSCHSLTSVTIGNNVTSIGSSAFSGCGRLTSVTIPSSIQIINDFAFYQCSNLTIVYYTGTAEQWAIGFGSYNTNFINATRYYYSETQPTNSGNYWHYNENNEVVVW